MGLTLIELLVTLSIAVILLAVAVPGMQDFMRRNRVDSATSDLVAAFNYARSESIRQGVRVSVCKSADGATCDPAACDTATRAHCWDRGWIVFTNPDDDHTVDAGETVLRVYQSLPSGVTVNVAGDTTFRVRITYQPSGRITNAVGGSFFICSGSAAYARRIALIGSGRVRTEAASTCA
ncbi:MAG: GspH/FimT family pseudopilin [Thiobacillaceae bacterium]|nr:GspH/FimT family pseudopilin [Thiobacillaceae bacterium]